MYYIEESQMQCFIKHQTEEVFVGPFESKSDAFFVSELLNAGHFSLEVKDYGEESA